MRADEQAAIDDLARRHLILLEQYRQLEREHEELRRRCAQLFAERERAGSPMVLQ